MFKQLFDPTRLELRYRFKATRERVFRAWTEPELIKKWFQAGTGFITTIAEVDLRIGGRFRIGMLAPQSDIASVATGIYRQIQQPEKLVFTWSWEHEHGVETLVTVELLDLGDQTELVLIHENFSGQEARDQHLQGWAGCLDSLTRFLEK